METTKNKLSQEENIFFQNLKTYLNTPLYFYGSIQRDDYLPKYSDIDISIFTNDEKSIIFKLQNFLNVKKSDFKKSLCIMDNTLIPGYKIKYNNEINIELCIFNEKYKKNVIDLHKKLFSMPYYICITLLFLKVLFYEFKIIPPKIFQKLKSFFMGINEKDKENLIFIDID
jgi:predicted nucleotidyltransferase